MDDKDLDDAALWAVIDSAAASFSSCRSIITATTRSRAKPLTPIPFPLSSPQPKLPNYPPRHSDGEVVQNPRPHKISRTPNVHQRSPITPPTTYIVQSPQQSPPPNTTEFRHSLAGQFPTVSLFKDYQNAAMSILEKTDYTMISGNPYIKKSGWRKISFYFNLSYEIKDKTIEFDENRNVLRAEFVVRAYMQGGRFSDGWGSCDRREKKFSKPNHDVPSTAETRAKNKACQDLLGIGEYRPGASRT